MLLAALCAAPAAEAGETVSATWGELNGLIEGRRVSLTLKDGTKQDGKALAVLAEGIRLEHARGEQLVARENLAAIKVNRNHKRWRIAGAAAGAVAGGVGAGVLNAQMVNETGGSSAVLAAIPAFAGGVGYLVGWAADRQTVEIRIAAGAGSKMDGYGK